MTVYCGTCTHLNTNYYPEHVAVGMGRCGKDSKFYALKVARECANHVQASEATTQKRRELIRGSK